MQDRVRQSLTLIVSMAGLVWMVGCATSATAEASAGDAGSKLYDIEKVEGGVYRFTAGKYRSVFLVTDEGILLTDPIDRPAARWLKRELATRFEEPIRYVVYSHDHPDHVYGGDVFDEEGVTFVGHRLVRRSLRETRAETVLPEVVFEEEMTISLGGKSVALTYHGRNNGRGSVSMLFEDAEVMFVVDWIVVGRMPFKRLPGYDLPGMIESTEEVLEMDFETFVGGHAKIGGKREIRRYLSYLKALREGVVSGIVAGESLEAIKKSLTLEEYSDLARFEAWRPLNIEGAYEELVEEAYMLRRPTGDREGE